jgi:hypothetical protein
MSRDIRAEIVDGELVVRVPINSVPTPSKSSGKTLVVASSQGIQHGVGADGNPLKVDGKVVRIGVNAFIAK